MTHLLQRYSALPRAGRWLVAFLGVFAGYFLVVEPVLNKTTQLNASAATKLARLSRSSREAAEFSTAEGDVRNGVQRFGSVDLPGLPKERSDALNRRINHVLDQHGVTDHTSSVKEIPLGSGSFDQQFGADVRVERLVAELQFETSPETVAAVLADLERSPEVAAVSRVQLRKNNTNGQEKKSTSRTIRATLAVETWQLVKKLKRSSAP